MTTLPLTSSHPRCCASRAPSGPSPSPASSPSWASAWSTRSSRPSPTTSGRAPRQVSLLFTSYMAVMGVAMLVTGVVSSRIGAKRTLLPGSSSSSSSPVSPALRTRRRASSASAPAGAWATRCSSPPPWPPSSAPPRGSVGQAIILFEAALGVGIAVGSAASAGCSAGTPGAGLLRRLGADGRRARRDVVILPATPPTGRQHIARRPVPGAAHRGLLLLGLTAIFYNLGFFTLLAAGPFPLPTPAIIQVGWIFFGWGMLLAFTSVCRGARAAAAVRHAARRHRRPRAASPLDLAAMAIGTDHEPVVTVGIVARRVPSSASTTPSITEAVMRSRPVERAWPRRRTASSGSAAAPSARGWPASSAERVDVHAPFWFGAGAVAVGVVVVAAGVAGGRALQPRRRARRDRGRERAGRRPRLSVADPVWARHS